MYHQMSVSNAIGPIYMFLLHGIHHAIMGLLTRRYIHNAGTGTFIGLSLKDQVFYY